MDIWKELRDEGVDSGLLEEVQRFREAHPLTPEAQERVPVPKYLYYGREVWESAAAALLCGEHLFCGDTLFAGSIGRTDLEGGSSAQMADSLRKLAQLPIPRETQVLPGHGEFSTFGAELDNNYYIRSALRGGNDIF